MRINVLGPLELYVNGRSIAPTATKLRQLLALFALHAGEVVAGRVLAEELWGDTPPESSQPTMQTYVYHLRQRLSEAFDTTKTEAAKRLLVTHSPGYLLKIAPENLDAAEYEVLADKGRQEMARENYQAAAILFQQALETWRGPALVDVPTGRVLSVQVNRLEESRLGVYEDSIEVGLWLGRHHALLSRLAELTSRYPLNERLCAQYMIAQYRSGRQWRALEIFGQHRAAVVNELGTEPSTRIQSVHRAILNSDSTLHQQQTSGQLLPTGTAWFG